VKVYGTICTVGPAIKFIERAANVYKEVGPCPVTKAIQPITSLGHGAHLKEVSVNLESSTFQKGLELTG
jgi:hypothetical protein